MDTVARAIASYTSWAERDEALRSEDAYAADSWYARFEHDLDAVRALDPAVTVPAAAAYLESADRRERAAAGQLLGRIGEARRGSTARSCAELLLARLLVETTGEAPHPEDEARAGLSVGVGLVWTATGDEVAPLELADHPNANVRYAVAHHLGMCTTDRQEDAAARAALATLLVDEDEGVRGWAEFGLDTLSV
jgi:hypothetical protein